MYTLKQLTQSTRLSDRTLRNYLDAGILHSQKENGIWAFTPQQVSDFFQNETVRSAIQVKNKSIVSDFWNDTHKKTNSACMIWDMPEEDPVRLMHFICDAVNRKEGMTMSFESRQDKSRIILSGSEADIFEILTEYHHQFSQKNIRFQSTYVEYPACICGYDHMNMFRVENLLYCSHFAFLQKGAEAIKKDGPILLILKGDSDREIAGYYELFQ
nr:hypothetical protein [uncultured Acetatifactor sp.]